MSQAPIALLAFISSVNFAAAFAGERPFDCVDNFLSEATLQENEEFRQALSADPIEQEAQTKASRAVEAALLESLKGLKLDKNFKTLISDMSVVIDNPIFDEALARALTLSNVKKLKSIDAFKTKLRTATERDQVEFAQLVVRQYESLLEKAFTWIDEDRFIQIEQRWHMDEKKSFKLMNRWISMNKTNAGEVTLGVLAWAKAIDGERILREIKTLHKSDNKLFLTDAEEIVITRIKTAHSDIDLALNKGPISEREFIRKMRYWNAWGWLKHKLNILRYPNESSFVIILSIVPVSIVHGLVKDWNLTNTVATIIGGVATCPPLIAKLTRSAVHLDHDAVWLEVYTLKQLSEFRRFITMRPVRARELGFEGLQKSVDQRIALLRKIRAEHLGE